jgi:hypothetical protein
MKRAMPGPPSPIQVSCWFCAAPSGSPCVVAGTARVVGGAYPFHHVRAYSAHKKAQAGKLRPAMRLLAGGVQ